MPKFRVLWSLRGRATIEAPSLEEAESVFGARVEKEGDAWLTEKDGYEVDDVDDRVEEPPAPAPGPRSPAARTGVYCPDHGAPMEADADYGSLTHYACPVVGCDGYTYNGDEGGYHSGVPSFATELAALVEAGQRDIVVRGLTLTADAVGQDLAKETQELLEAVNRVLLQLPTGPQISPVGEPMSSYERRES